MKDSISYIRLDDYAGYIYHAYTYEAPSHKQLLSLPTPPCPPKTLAIALTVYLKEFFLATQMPAIPQSSHHAHSFAENSFTSPGVMLFARWIPPLIRRALIVLLLISIPLALFLLIRSLMKSAPLHARLSPSTYQQRNGPRKAERLRSTWPPASCVTLAPEAENLPSPTIRWNLPSKNIPPILPRILRMKTWPVAGGSLLRSETMEEVNGCRRHVMVFGTPG